MWLSGLYHLNPQSHISIVYIRSPLRPFMYELDSSDATTTKLTNTKHDVSVSKTTQNSIWWQWKPENRYYQSGWRGWNKEKLCNKKSIRKHIKITVLFLNTSEKFDDICWICVFALPYLLMFKPRLLLQHTVWPVAFKLVEK